MQPSNWGDNFAENNSRTENLQAFYIKIIILWKNYNFILYNLNIFTERSVDKNTTGSSHPR